MRARLALTALAVSLVAPVAGQVHAAAAVHLTTAAAAAPLTTASFCDVGITMSDGAVMRADIFRPASTGRFPTVLTVTGYNKDITNPVPGTCNSVSPLSAVDMALVQKGYAVMVVDDRGTGASDGTWEVWGPRTRRDYSEELDWIQAQPWSDGSVGTTGTSYLGITSLFVAEADAQRIAAGKPKAVRAVWADVPMADAYRDVTVHGGNLDTGFMPLWLGLVNGLSDVPPSSLTSNPATVATWLEHIGGNGQFAAQTMASALAGGDFAYDTSWYQQRSPIADAGSIQAAVAIRGGWFDLFQRGEPLLYTALTHAADRKLWMTPTYHISSVDPQWSAQGYGTEQQVTEAWWDHWLKGVANGVDRLPPVNLYDLGANTWDHRAAWPTTDTPYTRLYLGGGTSGSAHSLNDGTLATAPGGPGFDSTPFLPLSSGCTRSTTQWTAGAAGAGTPCENNETVNELTALTYTTPPLIRDTRLTGLITADLWVELTRPDASFDVTLTDVAPDGTSRPLTSGWLDASHRALDPAQTWRLADGTVIRPFHPFTRAAQQPVSPGEPTELQVEVFPTSNTFVAGHRIRIAVTTADDPHMMVPAPMLATMLGGTIKVLRGPAYPSSIVLPMTAGGLPRSATVPGAAGATAGSSAAVSPRLAPAATAASTRAAGTGIAGPHPFAAPAGLADARMTADAGAHIASVTRPGGLTGLAMALLAVGATAAVAARLRRWRRTAAG